MLSGFELYPRWVPLISGGVGPTKISPVKQEARKRPRAVCLKG